LLASILLSGRVDFVDGWVFIGNALETIEVFEPNHRFVSEESLLLDATDSNAVRYSGQCETESSRNDITNLGGSAFLV
jgi:hypothetical protein